MNEQQQISKVKRKVICTMETNLSTVVVKQYSGFRFELLGEKLEAYVDYDRKDMQMYILDPSTGNAVFTYRCYETSSFIGKELETIQKAADLMIQNGTFEAWRKYRERESYCLLVKSFKTYKKANLLYKKHEDAERYEYEAERKRDKEKSGI